MVGLLKMERGRWQISFFFQYYFPLGCYFRLSLCALFSFFFAVFLFLIRSSSCIPLVYLMCFLRFLMIFRYLYICVYIYKEFIF